MIEITNLMIGDWVKLKGYDYYYKVESIYYNAIRISFNSEIMDIDIDRFEPIPLTEDILLANGFEAKHGYFRYNDENDFYLVTWNEISHHLILRTFDNGCSLDKDHVDYVHELQQVLRLCGLSELADNFKIE